MEIAHFLCHALDRVYSSYYWAIITTSCGRANGSNGRKTEAINDSNTNEDKAYNGMVWNVCEGVLLAQKATPLQQKNRGKISRV